MVLQGRECVEVMVGESGGDLERNVLFKLWFLWKRYYSNRTRL